MGGLWRPEQGKQRSVRQTHAPPCRDAPDPAPGVVAAGGGVGGGCAGRG